MNHFFIIIYIYIISITIKLLKKNNNNLNGKMIFYYEIINHYKCII